MSEKKGVIYILTNPSFPDYVKIGYADNIERRLAELNRSECTPFAFRVYATYEVNSRLSDLKLHSIIDRLNPSLRSVDNFNGKQRIREFYAMSPEDAYSILEAIAEIHGCEDKLKKIKPTKEEREAEETAQDIEEQKKERLAAFNFSMCQIPVGATVEFYSSAKAKEGIPCVVVDDHSVEYDGKTWSLTGLATFLTKSKWSVQGPKYFKYEGEWLNDIRRRLGV